MELTVDRNKQRPGLHANALHERQSAQMDAATHPVLELQQQVGNLAVQQLLRSGGLRAKLEISQPHDPDEQEADQVAERIMRMEDHHSPFGPPCPCQLSGDEPCDECKRKQQGIKRQAAPGHAPANGAAGAHSVLRGPSRPLGAPERAYFEPRFGMDLGRVRIHTDETASRAAAAISARAFTSGSNIAFARNQFAPETREGRRLLAHELTHVVQQQENHAPRIQRQPVNEDVKPSAEWRPGMLAKVVRDRIQVRENPPQYNDSHYKLGDILEVREVTHIHQWMALTVPARMKGQEYPKSVTPLYIDLRLIEPVDPATVPVEPPQDQVMFQVDVLNDQAFTHLTGADPSSLPEGKLIPIADAFGPDSAPWTRGAAPGAGVGWAGAPWPALPVPANATGVQWTQTKFGHFSQFANVPGAPTMGGYRSYLPYHGIQAAYGAVSGQPWTRPVPGRYFNDFWFRLLFSPKSQTLVYREGTPQHAALVRELILQGGYTEPYTFPPVAEGTSCSNCITVPRTETYGALGGKPVIVTPDGVYDITEFGRGDPAEPFTVEQAGRGKTMRSWLENPTVQNPSGEIETLNVARVPRSTVWGARGVACIRAGGVVLLVYGVYKSGSRLTEAYGTPEFGRVVAQETGSWVGGIIGGALGAAAAGAIACSPTGPGALVCAAAGFAGGLIVGAVGSVVGSTVGNLYYDMFESIGGLYADDAACQVLGMRVYMGEGPDFFDPDLQHCLGFWSIWNKDMLRMVGREYPDAAW